MQQVLNRSFQGVTLPDGNPLDDAPSDSNVVAQAEPEPSAEASPHATKYTISPGRLKVLEELEAARQRKLEEQNQQAEQPAAQQNSPSSPATADQQDRPHEETPKAHDRDEDEHDSDGDGIHVSDRGLPVREGPAVASVPGPGTAKPPSFFSRQAHPDGQYLPMTGQQAYNFDDRVYLHLPPIPLDNPGGRLVRMRFVSPNPGSNRIQGAAAMVEWRYRSSGKSTFEMNSDSKLQVKLYDRIHPHGRIVQETALPYWQDNLDAAAGVCARDLGEWKIEVSRDHQSPEVQTFEVVATDPAQSAWETQPLNGTAADAGQNPVIGNTSDQWLRHSKTYPLNDQTLQEGRERGEKVFRTLWHLRSEKGSENRNCHHRVWSLLTEYRENEHGYELVETVFDRNDPRGRTLLHQTGGQALPRLVVSFGQGMERFGNYHFEEELNGRRVEHNLVQVRQLDVQLFTRSTDAYPDNGGVGYFICVQANPPQWKPQGLSWKLALNDTNGRTLKSYSGDASFNAQNLLQNRVSWDGTDDSGRQVVAGTVVTPVLQVTFPQTLRAAHPGPAGIVVASAAPTPVRWNLRNLVTAALYVASTASTFGGNGTVTNELFICGGSGPNNDQLTPAALTGCTIQVSRSGQQLGELGSSGILPIQSVSHNGTDAGDLSFAAVMPAQSDRPGWTRGYGPIYLVVRTTITQTPFGGPTSTSVQYSSTLISPGYRQETSALGFIPGTVFAQFQSSFASFLPEEQYSFTAQPVFWARARRYQRVSGPVPRYLDTGSGRTMLSHLDLSVRTRGLPLVIGRFHLSEAPNPPIFRAPVPSNIQNMQPWKWSFQRHLEIYQVFDLALQRTVPSSILYVQPNGNVAAFLPDAANVTGFKPTRADITDKLTAESDGNYLITQKDGTTYRFSGGTPSGHGDYYIIGHLLRETDVNGNANNYTWLNDDCIEIHGPDDQYIQLVWRAFSTPAGVVDQPVRATDFTGRTVSYDYSVQDNSVNLVTAHLTENRSFSYQYAPTNGVAYQVVKTSVSLSGVQEKVVPNSLSLDQVAGVVNRNQLAQFSASNQPWSPDAQLLPTDPSQQRVTTLDLSGEIMPQNQHQAWQFGLDPVGLPASITDPLQNQEFYHFDPASNLLSYKDALGFPTVASYDANRNPVRVKDAAGHEIQMTWDNKSQLTDFYDPLLHHVHIDYDDHRNPLLILDPLLHRTTLTYDQHGGLASHTDNLGHTISYGRDGRGFVIKVTLPALSTPGSKSAIWQYRRDALGRKIESTDPNGNSTERTFDEADRVTAVTLPAVSATSLQAALPAVNATTTYNVLSQPLQQVNFNGETTTYHYDDSFRLDSLHEPGEVANTTLAYDSFNNVVKRTMPSGKSILYTPDPLNRIKTITYPGFAPESFDYDKDSRLVSWTKSNGVNFTYNYDEVSRLKRWQNNQGDFAQLTYDEAGRNTRMVDRSGTTDYTYTDNDQIETIRRDLIGLVRFNYDQGDRLHELVDPDSQSTIYTHNERDELTDVAFDNQSAHYDYAPNGLATAVRFSNGLSYSKTFDERNRLVRKVYQQGGRPVATYSYNRNQIDQILNKQILDETGVDRFAYTYTNRHELKTSQQQHTDLFRYPPTTLAMSYDASHNLVARGTDQFFYNTADSLISAFIGGSGLSFAYNGDGQQTGTQSASLAFNGFEQIQSLTNQNGTAVYTYDGAGERVQKQTSKDGTSLYLRVGNEVIREYDRSHNLRAAYLIGLEREAIKTNGKWYFYVTDAQESTHKLLDGNGNITADYRYSDWGELTRQTGNVRNPFLYTGQELDSESGYYFLRARYYDPQIARFVARDPIREQAGDNQYAYCSGDPINRVDPSGLKELLLDSGVMQYDPEGKLKLNYKILYDKGKVWAKVSGRNQFPADVDVDVNLLYYKISTGSSFVIERKGGTTIEKSRNYARSNQLQGLGHLHYRIPAQYAGGDRWSETDRLKVGKGGSLLDLELKAHFNPFHYTIGDSYTSQSGTVRHLRAEFTFVKNYVTNVDVIQDNRTPGPVPHLP